MRQISTVILISSLLVLFTIGVLVMPAAAETSVQQSSSGDVDQNAQVSGGDMQVQQESNVRTETDGTVVEQHSELAASKEAGEPAQVERDTDRRVINPGNASVTYDIDQTVTEDGDTLTAGQQVTQSVDDFATELAEEITGERTETVQATTEDSDATANAAASSDNADEDTVRQGNPLAFLSGVADALGDFLPFLSG